MRLIVSQQINVLARLASADLSSSIYLLAVVESSESISKAA